MISVYVDGQVSGGNYQFSYESKYLHYAERFDILLSFQVRLLLTLYPMIFQQLEDGLAWLVIISENMPHMHSYLSDKVYVIILLGITSLAIYYLLLL